MSSTTTPTDAGSLTSVLQAAAADAQAIAAEAKAWHWTVAGPTFGQLHALFDEVADHARTAVDELSERLVQLGARPPAFPGEWLRLARVDVPAETGERTAIEMLEHLYDSLRTATEALAADLRGAQEGGDPASVDVLVQWLRAAENDRWMVAATLRGTGPA